MLSWLLIALAILCALGNWAFFFMNWQRRRRQLPESVSTVPLVTQIFVLLAVLISGPSSPLQVQLFWLLACAEPSPYQLAGALLRRILALCPR